MHFSKTLVLFLTLLWTFSFSSCSHYSVIPSDAAPFKTIYVHTVTNRDFAPNVHTLFQTQIKQTILRDNRLTLVNKPQEADTQLYITIDDYQRNVNTRSSVDAGRFNSLNLELTILISLYDNQSNAYLFKNVPIASNESLFFNPVENSVNHREMEYQILPKITKNIASNILDFILSDWTVSAD